MRIYWRNNPAKFHPDPIWNDGALGFFKERGLQQQQEEQEEQQKDEYNKTLFS